ncbi:beta-ketoacyl-ACP reductase [Bradyrhizobium sp. CCBAU 051011]|uniref:SDR family NAD(P)-dependent oxidoreductase n=1 Tax=Bradyrhizobium sp. CCBAU 051011 TaxID=858422 RepID=UPI001373E446|nr:SDR family NAD(P)-dependent oxidoreductase [Bradyrhizobium sp. CCBAU 051011]QHO77848.1 beta-ketoacyl-ACP reductase [Bradyrhizobium sp. CCBAU 051011]
MKIDLGGKVIIVTGAGRGIGREIALMAAAANAAVVLAARTQSQLDQVASAIAASGGVAHPMPIDLREVHASADLVKATLDRFARIDVIVNNAGATAVANTVMQRGDDLRAIYDLNVFALIALTQAALRHMIRSRWGRIINISSVSAKYGPAYNSAYASSKAAVLGFTRSVARETAALGITSNAICPWHVKTDFVDQAMGHRARMFGKTAESYMDEIVAASPMKRFIEAREVAGLAVYLMSDFAAGITGQSLNVCGGTLME